MVDMKTQFNNIDLNCKAVDKAAINKRYCQQQERRKKLSGHGFAEFLDRELMKSR